MGNPIVTLSTYGYVSEPYTKMVKILGYFLSSLASETDTFKDKITSLSNIVAKTSSDYSELSTNISQALQKLYSNYFDKVTADCDVVDRKGYLYIKINVDATESGTTYKLERAIKITKSGDLIDYETELDKFYKLYVGIRD